MVTIDSFRRHVSVNYPLRFPRLRDIENYSLNSPGIPGFFRVKTA